MIDFLDKKGFHNSQFGNKELKKKKKPFVKADDYNHLELVCVSLYWFFTNIRTIFTIRPKKLILLSSCISRVNFNNFITFV